MDFVNEYVRNIVIFTLFVNIGGILINEGDSRRIYKFVCGLILMIIVISSFFKLLDVNIDDFIKSEFNAKELNELENKINSNNEYIKENSLTTYEMLVKDNVERIVEMENYLLDSFEMHCDTNNHITHLDLWISKNRQSALEITEKSNNEETKELEKINEISEIDEVEEIQIDIDDERKIDEVSKSNKAENNIIIGNIRKNVFILYGIEYENINVYIKEVNDERL